MFYLVPIPKPQWTCLVLITPVMAKIMTLTSSEALVDMPLALTEIKKPLDTNIPMLGYLRILAVRGNSPCTRTHWSSLPKQNEKLKPKCFSFLPFILFLLSTRSLGGKRRRPVFLNQQSKSYDYQIISISACLLNKTSRPRHMPSSSLTRVDLKVMARYGPYVVFMRIR